MKQILMTTAAFILLGAPAAFAQPHPGDHNDRHWREDQGGQAQERQRPAPPSAPQQAAQAAPAAEHGQPGGRPDANAFRRDNPGLQRDDRQNHARVPSYRESPQAFAERRFSERGQLEGRVAPQAQRATPDNRPQGREQNREHGQPSNGERNRAAEGDHNRFEGRDNHGNADQRARGERRDLRQYQHDRYAQRRFRFGTYQRPRDWHYRRWTYGEFLPSFYWSQNYWLNNFAFFGLPYPPPGCIWVRYGDDALLIDRYTGEIIQVVYGLFY